MKEKAVYEYELTYAFIFVSGINPFFLRRELKSVSKVI